MFDGHSTGFDSCMKPVFYHKDSTMVVIHLLAKKNRNFLLKFNAENKLSDWLKFLDYLLNCTFTKIYWHYCTLEPPFFDDSGAEFDAD